MNPTPSMVVYDLGNYAIDTKEPLPDGNAERRYTEDRFRKLKETYVAHGLVRSVEMVMLVSNHGHPHVLLLQVGSNFFKLPSGELNPGETVEEGVSRLLNQLFGREGYPMQWAVTERLCEWWRPSFENCIYPYLPPHTTRPKEQKGVYLISLPEKCSFDVPSNYKLVAVPLFEIFDNKECYGVIISALPPLLSRFDLLQQGPAAPHAAHDDETQHI